MKKFKYTFNGKTYLLPESEVENFLKDFPNAQFIEIVDDAPGKQTGVADQAVTTAPEDVTADTGSPLEDTSLESQKPETTVGKTPEEFANTSFLDVIFRDAPVESYEHVANKDFLNETLMQIWAGWKRGKVTEANWDIANQTASARDYEQVINTANKVSNVPMTKPMEAFLKDQEIFESAFSASGQIHAPKFMSWVAATLTPSKGGNTRNVAIQVILQSLAQQAGTLAGIPTEMWYDKDLIPEVIKGPGIGAGAALVAGQAGPQVLLPEELATVPLMAYAGFNTMVEGGAYIGEAIIEELGPNPSKEDIIALFEDEEKRDSIKRKAIARGATIGVLDAFGVGRGAKVANKTFKGTSRAAGKFLPKVAVNPVAKVTKGLSGASVDAAFGSFGEVAGQTVIGEEIDPAEVILEGLGGLSSVPQTLRNTIAKGQYRINREAVSASSFLETIRLMEKDPENFLALVEANGLGIKGDPIIEEYVRTKVQQLRKEKNIDSENILTPETRAEIIMLEDQLENIQGKSKAANEQRDLVQNKITEIYEANDFNIQYQQKLNEKSQEIKEGLIEKDIKAQEEAGKKIKVFEGENSTKQFKSAVKRKINAVNKKRKAAGKKEIDIDLSDQEAAIGGLAIGSEIFVDKTVAAKTGQLNVAGHEVLHTITNAYLQDPTNLNRVVEGFKRRLNSKQKNYVENELKARGYKEEQFNREYLNIFSDGIVNGDISYNDGVFTQLKDFIKDNIFVPLGLLNPDAIGFKDGRQVYNFLKEYNQNIQQGKFSEVIKDISEKTPKIDRLELSREQGKVTYYNDLPIEDMFKRHDFTYNYSDDRKKFDKGRRQEEIINDKIKELGGWTEELVNAWNKYAPKSMQRNFEDLTIEERGGPLTDKDKDIRLKEARKIIEKDFDLSKVNAKSIDTFFKNNPTQRFETAEMFRPLITQIVNRKYRDVPGFNTYKDLIIDEAISGQGGVFDIINTYNPEIGTLTGNVNQIVGKDKTGRPISKLERRITGIGNRILPPEFNQEITEIQEKVEAPVTTAPIKTEIKKSRNTVDRLNLSPTIKQKAATATAKILQTILPQVSLKKGVDFRRKFKQGVRDVLYKDVREELGGRDKDAYVEYVKDNAESIYQIIPLQDMVKRSPGFVTKLLDKNGKPIRSDESFTGKKSYAGNYVYVKKPFSEVKEDFIKEYTEGRNALETRRKFLVEVIAQEVAADEAIDILDNEAVVEKLEMTQDMKQAEITEEIERNFERGRFINYSQTLQNKINEIPSIENTIRNLLGRLISYYKAGNILGDSFEKASNDLNILDQVTTIEKSIIVRELNDTDLTLNKNNKEETNVQQIERTFNQQRGTFTTQGLVKNKKNKNYIFSNPERQTIQGIIYGFGENSATLKLFSQKSGGTNHVANYIFDENLSTTYTELNSDINATNRKNKNLRIKDYREKGIDAAKEQDLGVDGVLSTFGNALKEIVKYKLNLTESLQQKINTPERDAIIKEIDLVNKLLALTVIGAGHGDTRNVLRMGAKSAAFNVEDISLGFYPEHNPSVTITEKQAVIPMLLKLSEANKNNFENIIDEGIQKIKENNFIVNIKEPYKYIFESEAVKVSDGSLSDRITEKSLSDGINKGKSEYTKKLNNADAIIRTKEKRLVEVEREKDNFDKIKTKGRKAVEIHLENIVKKYETNTRYSNKEVKAAQKIRTDFLLENGRHKNLNNKEFIEKAARKFTERRREAGRAIDDAQYNKIVAENGLEYINDNFIGKSPEEVKTIFESSMVVRDDLGPNTKNLIFSQTNKNLRKLDEAYNLINASRIKTKTKEFREMLDRKGERPSSIKTGETSVVEAIRIAEKAKLNWKNLVNIFLPWNAEDYYGMIQNFAGKGKQGDKDIAFMNENLIDPYVQGTNSLDADRRSMLGRFMNAKKRLYNSSKYKLRNFIKNVNGLEKYTVSDALRVYIWNKNKVSVPGISGNTEKALVDFVKRDSSLKRMAYELEQIHRTDGYIAPKENWQNGTVGTDVANSLNKVKRQKYLKKWKTNVDEFLNDPVSRNKITAQYGTDFVKNLDKIVKRMWLGTNRVTPEGDKTTNALMDYINGSVGVVMFWNTRSAALQTISTINYLNWHDNNPYKMGKAFTNRKQYAKDFTMLWNSDYMVNRRAGVRINIQEAELADVLNESNKGPAVFNYIANKGRQTLKTGFTPTKWADSFAIATGGAAFYRNRTNTYIKSGMSEKQAEAKAFNDFKKITMEAQQSADPSRISNLQAGPLGRFMFAFQNTPFQYMRLTKRAVKDLLAGRGDTKTNISKIAYYLVAQNLMFHALQNALWAANFDDDETDEHKKFVERKTDRMFNNMLDSTLGGMGLGGKLVSGGLGIVKRIKDELKEDSVYMRETNSAVLEVASLSPPVDHKLRQAKNFEQIILGKTYDSNVPPSLEAIGAGGAWGNIPLYRILRKAENLYDAATIETNTITKLAMIFGWQSWELFDKETLKKIAPDKKYKGTLGQKKVKIKR